MEKSGRTLDPYNIKDISMKLDGNRKDFLNRVEKVVGETILFSQAAATAIGEISYQEAVDGVINYFRDGMRKDSNE